MPRTIKVDGRTIVVPDDATDVEINQLAGPAPTASAASNPTSSTYTPKPGNAFTSGHPIDTIRANFAQARQGAQPGDGMLMGALKNFGAGGADVVHGIGHAVLHPIDTVSSSLHDMDAESQKPIGTQLKDMVTSGRILGMGGEGIVGAAKGLATQPARTLGQIGTGAVIGGAVGEGIGTAAPAIRAAAIGDTDAAALRGLRVPASGKKVLPMQSSLTTARPFLQGADSLEDLQAKIKPTLKQIYSPIRETLDQVGGNPIQHPDGSISTIGDLEDERQQLSAMNRGLKTGDPAALQLAQQKGLSQADALAREKAIQGTLDPALSQFGIDPKGIRQAYGAVSRIGNQVAGRSTLLETPQPYGFGKLANPFELAKGVELTKPATYVKPLGNIMDAGRDIAAGRYWTDSPTDVGIREGFAKAGSRPDFGQYTPFQPTGMLGAPPIQLGGSAPVSTPSSFVPPPFNYTTTAQRLGRMLPAPPIQLGGAIEEMRPPPFHYDTTPMRMGRTLPSSTADSLLPLSSHTDIFPEQLPGASRKIPRTIEGKK